MNIRMRSWKISTKLMLINFSVLLVLSGMLAIVFLSFRNAEQAVRRIVSRDIVGIRQSTESVSQLTSVFANLLLALFTAKEDLGEKELTQLKEIVQNLAQQDSITPLRLALEDFAAELQTLLEAAQKLRRATQKFAEIEDDFGFNLEILKDILAEQLELAASAGNIPVRQHLEQIQAMLTGYGETFSSMTKQVTTLERGTSEMNAVDATTPLDEALDYFLLRLQSLTADNGEIAEQGRVLIANVEAYKTLVIELEQTREEFQTTLQDINRAKDQILAALSAQDVQITKTAQTMKAEIDRGTEASSAIIVALAGLMLLMLLFSSYGISRMVKPLRPLAQAAQAIAVGKIDIPLRQVKSRDEVGILAVEFHNMITYLREMANLATQISVGDLTHDIVPRSADDVLGQAFQRMTNYLQEMALVATQIADGNLRHQIQPKTEHDRLGLAFQRMESLRHTMSQIMDRAQQAGIASETLKNISRDLVTGSEQVSLQTQSVSSNIQQISRRAVSLSTAGQELAAGTQEISKNVNDVAYAITNAVNMATHANTTIERLQKDSKEIGDIIKVITEITQQTNLLALNATIEAARAGEVGRGFAVVANEVKELASQTNNAAQDITRRIAAIQSSSQETTTSLLEVAKIIQQVHLLSSAITGAVTQQALTTNEISANISDVADGSEEISTSIQKVADVAQQALRQATSVEKAAQELIALADQLRQLVQAFKI